MIMNTTPIHHKHITAFEISEAPSLDPIRVILQDIAPGRGRVIVECFGKAWAAYWGAMGDGVTLIDFLLKADADYIAGAMARNTPLPVRVAKAEADYLLKIVKAVKDSLI